MTIKRFTPATRFIDRLVRLPGGEPVSLAAHQRMILDHVLTPVGGRLPYTTVLWSEPKKSGKTSLASWVGSWVLNTHGPRSEVLCVGNDLEQSTSRVFAEIVRVQQAHPALARRISKATESLLLLDDGSTARPVALDASGESGANPSLVLHDEAWGITSERARRLWDELTPPPTRPYALRWASSYAGYAQESVTLWDLYQRGLKGEPVDGLPDCRAAGPLFMLWSHIPRMPWQTPDYYTAQRQELRPSAFLRLHENRWVSTEGAWLPSAVLERAIDRAVVERPPVEGVRYVAFVDNSGGSCDDMTLAVGHCETGRRIVDGVWSQDGRPPFNPLDAIAKFCIILAGYRVAKTHGDTFGGIHYITEYARCGVAYELCPLSPSELYEAAEVGFNRGDIALPNHAVLIEQFGALKEKGARIGHGYGGHDDFSNAAAGAIWLLLAGQGGDASQLWAGGSRRSLASPLTDTAPRAPLGCEGASAGSYFDRVTEDAGAGAARPSRSGARFSFFH